MSLFQRQWTAKQLMILGERIAAAVWRKSLSGGRGGVCGAQCHSDDSAGAEAQALYFAYVPRYVCVLLRFAMPDGRTRIAIFGCRDLSPRQLIYERIDR